MNGSEDTKTVADVKLQNSGNSDLVSPGSDRKGAGFRDLQNGCFDMT
jgi:hypothetical protein